ncbi:MAG: SIMPL domain-containing protein [Gammaproteobacteria bacterium]|nr:SIMPL domain-containing protein [Gammaproteobacteria bacterium]
MLFKIIFAAILGLSLAACVQTSDDTAAEQESSISVSGEGTVEVMPDIATINLGIQIKNAKLTTAQNQVADITQRFVTITRQLEIKESDVQTTSANIRPEYQWDKDRREQILIGYIAERQLTVKLRDLNSLGSLIEDSVSAGINQVSPPKLSSSKAREGYREALELAAIDARENAQTIANALHTEIDDVISVIATSDSSQPRPMMRNSLAMAEDSVGDATYNAGKIIISANLTAVFEIEDD